MNRIYYSVFASIFTPLIIHVGSQLVTDIHTEYLVVGVSRKERIVKYAPIFYYYLTDSKCSWFVRQLSSPVFAPNK